MPTIKEIAKISGVSVATVSNIINEKGKVSEETRIRFQTGVTILLHKLRNPWFLQISFQERLPTHVDQCRLLAPSQLHHKNSFLPHGCIPVIDLLLHFLFGRKCIRKQIRCFYRSKRRRTMLHQIPFQHTPILLLRNKNSLPDFRSKFFITFVRYF